MIKYFMLIVNRELLISYRQLSDVVNPVWFFVLVVAMFPLALGPDPKVLARIAPGVIWVAALLAVILSLDKLFRDDFADGALEQWLISPIPVPLLVLGKVFAHWLVTAFPLIVIAPVLGLFLSIEGNTLIGLIISLLLGTPTLTLIGAIGVALTVGLKKGSVILSLLVLPLYIPVLIFATALIEAATLGMSYSGLAAILAAILTGVITLAPVFIGLALKISIE